MNAVLKLDAARFAETLRDRDIISPVLFGERLHITMQRLAEMAGVHRVTLQRAPDSEKVQDFLRRSVGIIGELVELNGGDLDRAIYWYRNVPLVELGGDTAEQYVAAGKVEGVRRYIRNLSAGATG